MIALALGHTLLRLPLTTSQLKHCFSECCHNLIVWARHNLDYYQEPDLPCLVLVQHLHVQRHCSKFKAIQGA